VKIVPDPEADKEIYMKSLYQLIISISDISRDIEIIARDRTSGENSPFRLASILLLVVTPNLSPIFGTSMEL
jgi:hypothetical protein